jgi:hypothetical protein
MKYETLVPSRQWLAIAVAAAVFFAAIVFLIIRRWGITQLCTATLIPILAIMVFLLGFHGKDLDLNYSARPLAREIQQQAPGVPLVAVYGVKRDLVYGLAFYRDRPMIRYNVDGVPAAEHVLVIPTADTAELDRWLAGRIYKPLFLYESQGLAVYRVYAQQ